jgi:ribosomal protein L16/L10AE
VKMNEPYRKKTLYMQRKRQKDAPSVDIAPDSTWGEARVKPRERRDVRKATLSKATRLQARTARRGVGDPPPYCCPYPSPYRTHPLCSGRRGVGGKEEAPRRPSR